MALGRPARPARSASKPVPAAVALLLLWGCAPHGPETVAHYVGGPRCARCHAAEARAWAGSHHALAMRPAADSTVRGNFRDATFRYAGTETRFFRRDGRFVARTDGPDGALHDYPILYAFGVIPLQQYLVALPGGRLQALPVAWDTRPEGAGGGRWFHLYPGERVTHDDELHWTRWHQNWNGQCAACHSTNLVKGYDPKSRTYRTTWSEIDVACEACHGPGSRHLDWATRRPGWERIGAHGLEVALDERLGVEWRRDSVTDQPQRSRARATESEIQLCARCHSRRTQLFEDAPGAPLLAAHLPALLTSDLYHADGQIKDEVYEYGSFVQSRMYRSGVTCSDCHDPHRLAVRASGNGLCDRCHDAARYDGPQHHFHTPSSTGAACVACHMPAHTYMVVDPRRDHSFRVPRPEEAARLGLPDACTTCHTNRNARWASAQVRGWYGHDPVGAQRFAGALDSARRGAAGADSILLRLVADRDQPGIARATAALELSEWPGSVTREALAGALEDSDPLVRAGALQALDGFSLEERWSLARASLHDSLRVLRVLAAGALEGFPVDRVPALDRAAFDRAREEYVTAETHNADQPDAQVNLGNFHRANGDGARAEAAYRAALEIDPDWAPAYANLADLMRESGRDAEGERYLRSGLARQPRNAALHFGLGLNLVRRHDLEAALAELARAVELAPDEPRFSYTYAVGLDDGGRTRQALAVVRTALAKRPGDPSLVTLRGELEAKVGRR